MDNTVGRLQSLFPSHQLDVIIGSLLGDARLECRSKGERYPVSARLRIHQGEKQKEYVFWKYEQLKNLVSRSPRRIKAGCDIQRKIDWYSWYFHTRTMEELGPIYHYFYKSGEKILPGNIEQLLTPRAMTIWFMDDGSNTGESYTISTHCFAMKDQLRILDFLKEKFEISATILKDRLKLKIRIGRKEYLKLNRIIEPHIIPSMNYKICNPRNDLSVISGQIPQARLAV
jgi:hypothetical protein